METEKILITVNGKFLTQAGGLSDEYPDAYLFRNFDGAKLIAYRAERKWPDAQITIVENYGESGQSEFEVT